MEQERQAYMAFERAVVADHQMAASAPKRMAWALWKQARTSILGLQKEAITAAYAAGYSHGVLSEQGNCANDPDLQAGEWINSEASLPVLRIAGISPDGN